MIDEQARECVKDRLTLVRALIEKNDPLAVPSGAGPTRGADGKHDGEWLHEYAQLDSLVNYLLLTCFDVLGQRSHWTTFGGVDRRRQVRPRASKCARGDRERRRSSDGHSRPARPLQQALRRPQFLHELQRQCPDLRGEEEPSG